MNEERLSTELAFFRSKIEAWASDMRAGPAVRADMQALLNPSTDNAYVFCVVHGTAPRSHPYYHDKGIHCATCAEDA